MLPGRGGRGGRSGRASSRALSGPGGRVLRAAGAAFVACAAGLLACGDGRFGGSGLPAGETPPAEPAPPVPPDVAPDRARSPEIAGCPVFPPDDPWNADVSDAPVDPDSGALVAAIGAGAALRLGFGTEEHYGIPYRVVPADQPLVEIAFGTDGLDYSHESDHGPFPIPLDAAIQGGSRERPDPRGGDRHVVVVQRGSCRLFELFDAVRVDGGYRVASAVAWNLRTSPSRPAGWTSADGAGLPIFPGLVRWDEVSSGRIAHALRFTAPRVGRGWIAPANHCGPVDDPRLPPFGTRVRLRADFDLSPYTGAARLVLEALRRHGMILADVGAPWTLSGASDPAFGDAVRQLREHPVPGTAFEVVARGAVRTDC